jgi:hypothetical protein
MNDCLDEFNELVLNDEEENLDLADTEPITINGEFLLTYDVYDAKDIDDMVMAAPYLENHDE